MTLELVDKKIEIRNICIKIKNQYATQFVDVDAKAEQWNSMNSLIKHSE